MAKKPSPNSPVPSALLPGFQHLIPSTAAAPLAAHIRPLFLPDLVQQIARNKQVNANRREQAHPAFKKWAKDLKQGVLQQLHETQVEQDFNHVLLRALGYTTQSDVASDQPWTLTPKWNVPGSRDGEMGLPTFLAYQRVVGPFAFALLFGLSGWVAPSHSPVSSQESPSMA